MATSAGSSTTTITIRNAVDGGAVAIDEDTNTKVEGEEKAYVALALVMKLEGEHATAKQVADASSPRDLLEALGSNPETAQIMQEFREFIDEKRSSSGEGPEEKPEPSAIRGIIKGSTDKSAAELVRESRERDEERIEKLSQ